MENQVSDIKLGNLNFLKAANYPKMMASSVAEGLIKLGNSEEVGVVEIDPSLSDTAAFCEQYKVGMNEAANCVVLEAKRGDKSWLAACVVLGSTRADVNGVVRRTLDARKVSFAPMEQAVLETKMEYGGISPIGLPADWPILIDKAVVDSEYVILGSGIRGSKLAVPGSFFALLPNAKIIDGLSQLKRS